MSFLSFFIIFNLFTKIYLKHISLIFLYIKNTIKPVIKLYIKYDRCLLKYQIQIGYEFIRNL